MGGYQKLIPYRRLPPFRPKTDSTSIDNIPRVIVSGARSLIRLSVPLLLLQGREDSKACERKKLTSGGGELDSDCAAHS